jgi:hypothetical protein
MLLEEAHTPPERDYAGVQAEGAETEEVAIDAGIAGNLLAI